MDELAAYNKERWEALAGAGIEWSRPLMDLNVDSAVAWLDSQGAMPPGGMGDLSGRDVLCLASGGGQQSAVFGVLGARVTVLDFSETQLQRDRETAVHYGFPLSTVQGDMRDLSCFDDNSFDIVWHPHSINFVPEAQVVFQEVARVLRTGGLYRIEMANPFLAGLDETVWDGNGYPLKHPYTNGAELLFDDPHWDVYGKDGTHQRIVGPHEFRHSLSTVMNSLIGLGFVMLAAWEAPSGGDPDAEPGTWEHFIAIAPPWMGIWASLRPDVFAEKNE
jgi:SAM-dependent methyltransferase